MCNHHLNIQSLVMEITIILEVVFCWIRFLLICQKVRPLFKVFLIMFFKEYYQVHVTIPVFFACLVFHAFRLRRLSSSSMILFDGDVCANNWYSIICLPLVDMDTTAASSSSHCCSLSI